jgi:hypothetical protein
VGGEELSSWARRAAQVSEEHESDSQSARASRHRYASGAGEAREHGGPRHRRRHRSFSGVRVRTEEGPHRVIVESAHDSDVKAQWVRVLDVFLLGPLMVYGARRMPRGPAALALGVFGVTTILYNAVNYAKIEKREALLRANI